MAEQSQQNQGNLSNITVKGLVTDPNDLFMGSESWTRARNLTNASHDGQLGATGNEQANLKCIELPMTIIGSIFLYGDTWAIFSTDDTNSEVGIFDESTCDYQVVVNDPALNFNRSSLITGVSKENHQCQWEVYFDDGSRNPSRKLNLSEVPYIEKVSDREKHDCNVPEYTGKLDAEKLRLSRLVASPEIELNKAQGSGGLLNGSYQVVVAHTINGIRVTDYFTPSNVQSLFSHENGSGSLEVNIKSMDTNFEEFELVVISVIAQQTVAKRFGLYSTRQSTVLIDHISPTLITIPLELIPLQSPTYERSDAMYEVNDYLIRTGIHTKFDFNYQPQANNIQAKWVAVEYPADYYVKGGNNTNYLRDEQYSFFIKWIYNTGEKSSAYTIPGRAANEADMQSIVGKDALENGVSKRWQVYNTAAVTSIKKHQLADGGNVIKEGDMGYWESSEKYPDDKPHVWGDLCGKSIRHHKFPDIDLVPHFSKQGSTITLLGVRFENITAPLDNSGKPIAGIVAYEILRGSREGNKSIIAKGLLNNMAEYDIPDPTGGNRVQNKQGLYPNYPYNDLRLDPFLSKSKVLGGCDGKGYKPMGSFRKDVFTFHSPETMFKNPYLSASELKIHGELYGDVTGSFEPVYKHPKSKLLRDFALIVASTVGVGTALHAIKGKKKTITRGPKANSNAGGEGLATGAGVAINAASGPVVSAFYAVKGVLGVLGDVTGLSAVADVIGMSKIKDLASDLVGAAVGSTPGVTGQSIDIEKESTPMSELPMALRVPLGVVTFGYFFSKSTDEVIKIIRAMSPYSQHAYQYNSHADYNKFQVARSGNTRRKITRANYLEQHLQEFGDKYRINNLFRPRTTVIELADALPDPVNIDNTRKTIGEARLWDAPQTSFATQTSAHYASLKLNIDNQYGQLENITIVPVSTNAHKLDEGRRSASPVLFGGDTYINRYTEKNTFFYFNDWMQDFPDGFEYDYRLRHNVPFPRYWMNTEDYDASSLTSAVASLNFKTDVLPNDSFHLDRNPSDCKSRVSFTLRKAFMYLFNNGVRDFFVESEVNLAHRDYGDRESQRFYDPHGFTDLPRLFRSDIIKSNNYYKYDYSLSVSKLYQNYISWGLIQARDYDPLIEEKCHSYYPNRAIYSLKQIDEFKKDNWTAFLANNYKDFPGKITTIKPIGKNGAMIMMASESPVMFDGIDRLQTNAMAKITIGDGGLFSQDLQNLVNTDASYEYGSTQSKYSVIGTPHGIFWMSVEQGKIFQYAGQLDPISRHGNAYWFSRFLPYQLTKQFPQFELIDNPVKGIGCQAIYDNTAEIVYFSKKDYFLKDEYVGRVSYHNDDRFIFEGTEITLGDPQFFEDGSWTYSYDPKGKQWLSYHDWHPDFVLPGKSHFMTVKEGSIWKHNTRTDLFCNYYGKDYPFEIEIPVTTGSIPSVVRNVEYSLECFEYLNGGRDKHHVYDGNFDGAVLYNSEQNTGQLNLIATPKNNPVARLGYPKIHSDSMDILYAKEENKYSFNQFWDNTQDRSARESMWVTGPDGFRRKINTRYINYSKPVLQRKKIRHYAHRLLLSKSVSGPVKFVFRTSNIKVNHSMR